MPRNRQCVSERVTSGYTGDVVGEDVPADVFRFLVPGFRQRPGPGVVDEVCEMRTGNFGPAIGRFAYDPPMNCRSRQEVPERSPVRQQRTLRMWNSPEFTNFAEAARWRGRHESDCGEALWAGGRLRLSRHTCGWACLRGGRCGGCPPAQGRPLAADRPKGGQPLAQDTRGQGFRG